MQNTFYLTLNQAAKETGRSKSIISNAIKSGKLSVVEKTTEGYKIDPAELFRVFNRTEDNAKKEQLRTYLDSTETLYLQRENELLRDQLKQEREQSDDLRQRLDNSDQERRQLLAMLTHQPQPEVKPTEDKPVNLLFEKLFGNRK